MILFTIISATIYVKIRIGYLVNRLIDIIFRLYTL